MKGVLLSPAAESDLERTWDYSAERWGPDQADRYTDDIRDACRGLATGAKRGRPVDVRADYLKYATGTHMIYFLDTGDQLQIIRILHQGRDVWRNLPA